MSHSKIVLLLTGILCPLSICIAQNQAPAKREPVLDITSMDASVDPCVDFFAYSCNGWIKRNPIPPDQSSWSAYSKVQDENRLELRGILESAASETGGRPVYRQ